MTVGELFLNMGIKGTEKTVGALSNVKKGLSETASMSLEAKAGIVAAMYAMEQLFAASGHAGTGLTNFTASTGVAAKTLQQYQYAGRQAGITNETTASTFKTLQTAMAQAATGHAPPAGMAQLAKAVGGISEKYDELAQKPEKLFQYLQKGALKIKDIPFRNQILKSFGLDDAMISGLARNAFRPEVFSKAPTYSNQEVNQLDKANIAWSNLGTQIEMAIGHFNAMHGEQLVTQISQIVTQVIQLVEAITKLGETLHIFDAIGLAFKGWNSILEGANTAVGKISGAIKSPEKRKEVLGDAIEGGKNVAGFVGYLGKSLAESILPTPALASPLPVKTNSSLTPLQKIVQPAPQALSTLQKVIQTSTPQPLVSTSSQRPAVAPPGAGTKINTSHQNNTVNINNTFAHPGVDSKKTSNDMKKQIEGAARQLFSQSQGG